jgi:hypothetical protein
MSILHCLNGPQGEGLLSQPILSQMVLPQNWNGAEAGNRQFWTAQAIPPRQVDPHEALFVPQPFHRPESEKHTLPSEQQPEPRTSKTASVGTDETLPASVPTASGLERVWT